MADKLPPIPADLLEALEALFPERCADLTWTDRQVWHEAGKRHVVRFLREHFSRQTKNILES